MSPVEYLAPILGLADVDTGFETTEVIEIAIAGFALVLLALTISAYRKSRLKRLLLVSAAFGLFAVQVGLLQLDEFVFALGYETDRLIVAGMELVILLLFFLAVVVKE